MASFLLRYFETRMIAFAIGALLAPAAILWDWTDGSWLVTGGYVLFAAMVGFVVFRRRPTMSLSLSERQNEERARTGA